MTQKLIQALKDAGLVHVHTTIRVEDENCVDTRYLGEWEMPEGEDDDGDYDWEVPSGGTVAKIKAIALEHEWQWQQSEKNWITFTRSA